MVGALTSIPSFGDPTQPLGNLLDNFADVTTGLTGTLAPLGDLFA